MSLLEDPSLSEQRDLLVFEDGLHVFETDENPDADRSCFNCNRTKGAHVVIESPTAAFLKNVVHLDQDWADGFAKSIDHSSSLTTRLVVRRALFALCLK